MGAPFQHWCGQCICERTENEDMQWTAPRFALQDEPESSEIGESDDLGSIAGSISPREPGLAILEHRISELMQHAGPYLQVEDDLLRGVSLRSTLKGLGWMWRKSALRVPEGTWQRQWECLHRVQTYNVFISHTWKSSGSLKVLALMLSSGWQTALSFWLFTLFAVVFVQVVFPDVPQPFKLDKPVISFDAEYPLAPWLLIAGPLALLMGLFCTPYFPKCCRLSKEETCFVDIACIHQADEALKERGIYGIGGFLRHAEELRVLWTPPYLTRLWCVFELAAYRVANPTGKISLAPIFIEHTVFILAPAFWAASWCYSLSLAAGLPNYGYLLGEALPIGVALLPLLGFVHGLRRLFREKHKLYEDLKQFKLASAECSEPFDYIFVTSAIHRWYGSAEEFERFVQGPLFNEISGNSTKTVDVPLAYCLLLVTAPVSATIDETIGLWSAGAPVDVVLSALLGHAYSIGFCCSLVSIKLLYYLCDRFAVARRPGLIDYLQTVLIYTSWSGFFLLGSYTGELSYRHSLKAAACHASITTVVAFFVCSWKWILDSLSACRRLLKANDKFPKQPSA